MKNILLILLLVPLIGSSQPYFKLIEPNKYWDIAFYSGGSVCSIDNGAAFRYYFDGDTLMPNGITYQKTKYFKMFSQMSWLYCPPFLVDTIAIEGYFFIREDTIQKRVYTIENNQDQLVYDFNLNTGDTLNSVFAGGGILQTVDSTSMQQFPDGTLRKIIYLRNGYYYIEGIGSPTSGLAQPMPPFWVGVGYYMFCVKQNTIDLIGPECSSVFLSISDLNNPDVVRVYPSPASNKLIIENKGIFSFQLLNLNGETILTKECENKNVIDCTHFSSGLYLIQIITKTQLLTRKILINSL
ncbi:MAG: T9SS type A sorting domain-containing protein [Bacteroidota bacterium]